MSRQERREHVAHLMEKVGLKPEQSNRYPHQFSGGQRQRVGIAPRFGFESKNHCLDEPVSALDVSIQAQVINLLLALQEEMGLSYLFIAHDLSVVEHNQRSRGCQCTWGSLNWRRTGKCNEHSLHPYTQALLSAVPVPDPEIRRQRILLAGDVPSPLNPPAGCYFQPALPPTHADL